MNKARKWLIIEVIAIVSVIAGAILFTQIRAVSLLTIALGCYAAGYAASRLDVLIGPMHIHVEISRHPKIQIIKG